MLRDSAAAEPVGRGGLELREKCLPSSSSLPGSTVPSWARHTWPRANWCHWPGWAAGAVSSTQRGDTELCSARGSHSLHSYQEKAKAARMQPQAPSQPCGTFLTSLWWVGRAGATREAQLTPPAAPKPPLHGLSPVLMKLLPLGVFSPCGGVGAVLEPPRAPQQLLQTPPG